jgi:hypothetical protein
MNQSQATQLLSNLLQQPPTQVQNWIRSVWIGQQRAPEKFNWLGLADAAALRARSQQDLSWAKVASMLYERLADEADLSGREKYIESAMQLKAYMITKIGPVPGDSVLDINQILHWFFENLKFSPEEATQKSTVWKTLSIEDIRELRLLKNRLSVLTLLVNSGKIKPNQELSAWLLLRNKLP